jgi:hypothetical protein
VIVFGVVLLTVKVAMEVAASLALAVATKISRAEAVALLLKCNFFIISSW